MSLTGLQLTVPHTAAELFAHPIRFVVFFGTFAIVSVFWVTYHRIMATGFAPERIDMLFAFAYLAFVALIPYAMQVNTTLSHTEEGSYAGFGFYLIVFLGIMVSALVLNVRGLRRGWYYLDDRRRRLAWRRFVTTAMMTVAVLGALASLLAHQILTTSLFFFGTFAAIGVARRVFPEPRPSWLGITATDGTYKPWTVS